MELGIRQVDPAAEVVKLSIADGGEGTLDAILSGAGGERIERTVVGPLGKHVAAAYGLLSDGKTAVIEMASAAGLGLVAPADRDPRRTSTYGVGQLLMAAVESGADRIIVGLGGSCTNDGGAGMLQALGAAFIDAKGAAIPVPITGADLATVDRIDLTNYRFPTDRVAVVVASDVTNPLIGLNGASAIYGPQKGASPDDVIELDLALANYASVIEKDFGVDIASRPGAGAAGGLGAALMAFLGAEMCSGIDLVLDTIAFEAKAAEADFVFTGEGSIDLQTLQGKVIFGILARCKKLNVPLVAFAGSIYPEAEEQLFELGLRGAVPIVDGVMSLENAIDRASALITRASARTMRVLKTDIT